MNKGRRESTTFQNENEIQPGFQRNSLTSKEVNKIRTERTLKELGVRYVKFLGTPYEAFIVIPLKKYSFLRNPLTFNILHDHAEVPASLEGAEHGDHKGVLSEGQDVSLYEGLLDLVPQDQVLLVDLLHGKTLTGLPVTYQVHRTDGGREEEGGGTEEGRRREGREGSGQGGRRGERGRREMGKG